MHRFALPLAAATLLGATPPTPNAPRTARTIPGVAADSFGIRDLLDIATTAVADLSSDGQWLALTVTTRRDQLGAEAARDGDPTYLRAIPTRLLVVDTKSLAQRSVFPDKKPVRTALWSPDATRLAILTIENDALQLLVWNRATGKFTAAKLPAGQYIAENSELRWTDDGARIEFAARSADWKAKAKKRFDELTKGPVTVLDGTDDFLEWDAMNRLNEERSIVSWDAAKNTIATLHAETRIGQWVPAKDGSAITTQQDITRKTDYDVIGGREWKLVTQGVPWCVVEAGGQARCARPKELTLVASLKGAVISWADDGKRFAIGRDGRILIGSIADSALKQLVGPANNGRAGGAGTTGAASAATAPTDTSPAARAARAKERFTLNRWSPQGDAILATNSEGYWIVDAATGTKELIITTPDSADTTSPRSTFVTWSNDGRYLYFTLASRTQYDRGLSRYDRTTKERATLIRGDRLYGGLRISKNGETALFTIAEGNHLPDLYVAGPDLANPRRVIESNPQLARKPIAKTELIHYLDADGKTRYGVLAYPTNYTKGTKYPTVFIIYEDFFDDTWDGVANLLAAHGYAVVKPSVGFEIGFPGEAWAKGVTAAANEVIRMGVADSSRLGVQGTSYGGYATNLLVTQTDRFKAAINMSGKVDFISFYTDSPRLGVRNIHAAEKSQDRIGATMWQQPQKYEAHSAILFADRIKTPLLLMTGGEDHNVPAINTREMYYALRRLGKTVTWANYANGGHGVPSTTEADFIDYHQRMLDWYAKYLAAPKKANAASN